MRPTFSKNVCFPKIRHRAARHQWSVSNAWACWLVASPGIVLPGEDRGISCSSRVTCMAFLQSCFSMLKKNMFLRFELQIASQLASPGSPQDSNGCQNGAKMHPKMGAIAPSRIKMPIVSKTYYLLCFSYILVVPETFKHWFSPSQFPLQLLSPPFGHQGILKKRLGCHLQAINTKKCRKWSPQGNPS